MIVDASVAFKWIFIEDDSAVANALIGENNLIAPTLLLAEIGNALWKKGRLGELGDHGAYATQLGLVASLVSTIDESDVIPRALDLALVLDHPIYDCIYLAVAQALEQDLITADARFFNKVTRSDFAGRIRLLGT